MERIVLEANFREKTGKHFCKKIRKQNQVPAVMYGKGINPINLSVPLAGITGIVKKYPNAIINLKINKNGEEENHFAIIKDIQRDSITSNFLHIDFLRVSMEEKLTVSVPLHLIGTPVGVKDGGVMELIIREIEIECLPGDIPENIEVDVSGLKIGHSIHVGDIKTDEKIKVITPKDMVVVTVKASSKEEIKEEVTTLSSAAAEPEVVKKKEKEEKVE